MTGSGQEGVKFFVLKERGGCTSIPRSSFAFSFSFLLLLLLLLVAVAVVVVVVLSFSFTEGSMVVWLLRASSDGGMFSVVAVVVVVGGLWGAIDMRLGWKSLYNPGR